ncbi:hypothetical protein M514_18340 [Trichuris suis]|uniref:Retroviral polymerase SH3-like domain-containing protein n=1 Tax=Trichuris suis TaxID=68888 RepID=A0A085NJ22_9BILA
MNRTLLDLVRSAMSGCALPRAAWAELTGTAAYVRNRATNKHNQNKTPYELWFNRKPSVRHLRACGCDVYVHVLSQKRNPKLDLRAREGLLVGYALKGKGWRIWVLEVLESRDCVFVEKTTLPQRSLSTEDGSHISFVSPGGEPDEDVTSKAHEEMGNEPEPPTKHEEGKNE